MKNVENYISLYIINHNEDKEHIVLQIFDKDKMVPIYAGYISCANLVCALASPVETPMLKRPDEEEEKDSIRIFAGSFNGRQGISITIKDYGQQTLYFGYMSCENLGRALAGKNLVPITRMVDLKTYTIPVTWEMYGTIEVEAESLQDAIDMVNRDEDVYGKQFSLPDEQDYAEGSFEVSDGLTIEEIEDMYPDNKME